jgi:hypothetical protein
MVKDLINELMKPESIEVEEIPIVDQIQRARWRALIPRSAIAFALSSCASVSNTPVGQVEFTGWFQQTGEFRIYDQQSDMGSLYDGSCTSGRFADRTKQQEAQRFNNMKVTVSGKAFKFSDLPVEGAPFIENYCNSEQIIYGDDIRIAD